MILKNLSQITLYFVLSLMSLSFCSLLWTMEEGENPSNSNTLAKKYTQAVIGYSNYNRADNGCVVDFKIENPPKYSYSYLLKDNSGKITGSSKGSSAEEKIKKSLKIIESDITFPQNSVLTPLEKINMCIKIAFQAAVPTTPFHLSPYNKHHHIFFNQGYLHYVLYPRLSQIETQLDKTTEEYNKTTATLEELNTAFKEAQKAYESAQTEYSFAQETTQTAFDNLTKEYNAFWWKPYVWSLGFGGISTYLFWTSIKAKSFKAWMARCAIVSLSTLSSVVLYTIIKNQYCKSPQYQQAKHTHNIANSNQQTKLQQKINIQSDFWTTQRKKNEAQPSYQALQEKKEQQEQSLSMLNQKIKTFEQAFINDWNSTENNPQAEPELQDLKNAGINPVAMLKDKKTLAEAYQTTPGAETIAEAIFNKWLKIFEQTKMVGKRTGLEPEVLVNLNLLTPVSVLPLPTQQNQQQLQFLENKKEETSEETIYDFNNPFPQQLLKQKRKQQKKFKKNIKEAKETFKKMRRKFKDFLIACPLTIKPLKIENSDDGSIIITTLSNLLGNISITYTPDNQYCMVSAINSLFRNNRSICHEKFKEWFDSNAAQIFKETIGWKQTSSTHDSKNSSPNGEEEQTEAQNVDPQENADVTPNSTESYSSDPKLNAWLGNSACFNYISQSGNWDIFADQPAEVPQDTPSSPTTNEDLVAEKLLKNDTSKQKTGEEVQVLSQENTQSNPNNPFSFGSSSPQAASESTSAPNSKASFAHTGSARTIFDHPPQYTDELKPEGLSDDFLDAWRDGRLKYAFMETKDPLQRGKTVPDQTSKRPEGS